MPRFLLVAYFSLFFLVHLNGQIYHYETGKVLPANKNDTIIWNKGTFNNYPADYGTLIVKENRSKRNSRLINIPIVRVPALNRDTCLDPIYILNGGPGESNFQPQLFIEQIIQNRDIVIVGYRGVDGSVVLKCQCLKDAFLSDSLTVANAQQLFADSFNLCVNKWEKQQIDISGYSMNEVVADLESTRKLLGYEQLNFISFSYGTMLSQLYQNTFSDRVNKMVLIGARPANDFLFSKDQLNSQIYQLYKTYYSKDTMVTIDSLDFVLGETDVLFKEILNKNKQLNAFRFLFFGFSKLYSVEDIELLFSAYLQALNGKPETLLKQYNEFYKNFPGDIVMGDNILKKQASVDFFKNSEDATIGNKITNVINTWYNPQIEMLVKSTKNSRKTNVMDSVETLFISGEFDVASPQEYLNKTIVKQYPNSEMVIISNSGHLDLFYSKKEEVNTIITKFFSH